MIERQQVQHLIGLLRAATNRYAEMAKTFEALTEQIFEWREIEGPSPVMLKTHIGRKLNAYQQSFRIYAGGNDFVLRTASQVLEHGVDDPIEKAMIRHWIAEVESGRHVAQDALETAQFVFRSK